ncbi:MAG: crossover junction endodeoxyribonuclease RuvC [Steroidobacteraceae bacterium]
MTRYASRAWRSFQPGAVAAVTLPAAAACRILGLDPGSRYTGYGVIDCGPGGERHVASGRIAAGGGELAPRLRTIFEAVVALVEAHRPDEVAIERVFVHVNPDSALKLGQARGAALCAALARGAAAHEYAPRQIKMAVSGYGAADKAQVAQMVTTLLALKSRPVADAADALAVALCHAQTRRLGALGAAGRARVRVRG